MAMMPSLAPTAIGRVSIDRARSSVRVTDMIEPIELLGYEAGMSERHLKAWSHFPVGRRSLLKSPSRTSGRTKLAYRDRLPSPLTQSKGHSTGKKEITR